MSTFKPPSDLQPCSFAVSDHSPGTDSQSNNSLTNTPKTSELNQTLSSSDASSSSPAQKKLVYEEEDEVKRADKPVASTAPDLTTGQTVTTSNQDEDIVIINANTIIDFSKESEFTWSALEDLTT